MPASREAAATATATPAAAADAAEIAVTRPTNNDICNRNRGGKGTDRPRVGSVRGLGSRKARAGGGYISPSDGSVRNGFYKCHRKRWENCPRN